VESLFFNAGEGRFRRQVTQRRGTRAERVDISNGLLFFDLRTDGGWSYRVHNRDRFILLVLPFSGDCRFTTATARLKGHEGDSLVYAAGPAEIELEVMPDSHIFAVAVADFYLKRYLGFRAEDPIDHLYGAVSLLRGLREVDRAPLDALSYYYVKQILQKSARARPMAAMRLEYAVMALLLHRFGLMELVDERIDAESLRVARCVRERLALSYANPPTIAELAKACATNTTRIKSAFKRVYGQTVGAYVRTLRLQQANELLREERMSIGEVARRVGFSHQGYFSRLFYETFGIHPKALKKFGS